MSEPSNSEVVTWHRIDRHMIAGLARAIDWVDNSLQHVLASQGYKPVHRTQSLILVHIASGIDAPSDIAREMGLTRQNVHQMTKGLIDDGIVEQYPDPRDPRRSRYRLTEASLEIRNAAIDALARLERVIHLRSGLPESDMSAFLRVLAADWGPEINSHLELEETVRREG